MEQSANMAIKSLTLDDLPTVDDLMKKNSRSLGFLPEEALGDYVRKDGVLGAKNEHGELIGYLLFSSYPHYIRIAHLCVAEQFRNQGIARGLIDELKKSVSTQKVIRLNCRRDYAAHHLWPKLGFVALDEMPGRSIEKHLLTRWCLNLAPDDQLNLFRAKTSDETLDVVIDAQVFYHLVDPGDDHTIPSQALLSDFMVDSLRLRITDELYNEINRHDDPLKRKKSRARARDFPQVEPTVGAVGYFEGLLRGILPSRNPAEESDIRHLSKTAASDVDVFVTEDQDLLDKADKIRHLTNLQVFSPTRLIIQHHRLADQSHNIPQRISGLRIQWKPITADDLDSFPYELLLDPGERKGRFRARLNAWLSRPTQFRCEFLVSGGDVLALRIQSGEPDRNLTVHLIRVVRGNDQQRIARLLITDSVSYAVEKNLDTVTYDKSAVSPDLIPHLQEMGFTEVGEDYVRFCFSRILSRSDTLSAISKRYPDALLEYSAMSGLELESRCSPLSLTSTDQKSYFVPIRPGYALNLFDREGSGYNIFGGDIHLLLRYDNVYYRKKTHYHMLKSPGRILWYVSREKKQIVAVSHLDTVEVDSPKALFIKYKRFGILEWRDIYNMCNGNVSSELMVLKFSNTFPFRKPVSLNSLRELYDAENISLVLQSPSTIPSHIFRKVYCLGFPD